MRTIATDTDRASGPEEEPTLSSIWYVVTQEMIDEDLLEWPPDVFTLTDVILDRSEAYRFAFPAAGGGHRIPRRHGPRL